MARSKSRCRCAYRLLERALLVVNGRDTPFAKAIAIDLKGGMSIALNVVAVGVAFVSTPISYAILLAVVLMWLIPDRRFEPLINLER